MRWTYIVLWSFACVLSRPPSPVLSLNCPGTQRAFTGSLLLCPDLWELGSPVRGDYVCIPAPAVALVFLRLQRREGRREERNIMKMGEITSDKRKTSPNTPCGAVVAVLRWATGMGGPESPKALTSTGALAGSACL